MEDNWLQNGGQKFLDPLYLLQGGLALLGCTSIVIIFSGYSYIRHLGHLTCGDAYGCIDKAGPFILCGAIFLGIVAIGSIFILVKVNKIQQQKKQVQEGICIQHKLGSVPQLEYQPSDIFVRENMEDLLVPSLDTIHVQHATGGHSTLATVPDADLQGIIIVDNKVFAL